MPRVCALADCGKTLLTKTGKPDFRRHWCSVEHRNIDRKETMAAKRGSVHGKKCRLCGRAPIRNSGVRDDTPVCDVFKVDMSHRSQELERLRSERPEEELPTEQ